MLVFKDAKPDLLEASSIALGFFDGLHPGHVSVINTMLEKAKANNLTSCVVTFSNHPLEILKNTKISSIIPLEKRLELIENLGVEAVLLLNFSQDLISLSAEDYLRDVLIKSLHPKFITVGFNHFFGAHKKGDNEFLRDNASKYGYEVLSVPPVEIEGEIVSSSLIKKHLELGDIENANKYLGRDFTVSGEVVHGKEIGRTIGFATANLLPPPNMAEIPNGVYAGWTKVEGQTHKSVINVGNAPTLKNCPKTIEAHLLHFDKDIYGQNIEVGFTRKIRDERKFNSKEELIDQIRKDCSSFG